MHPEVAALVQSHALPDLVARDIDALLARHLPAPPVISAVERDQPDEPVDIQPTLFGALADDPTGEVPVATPKITRRYEDLGGIGVGGMAEVRRVRDLELNRILAMKIVHGRLMTRPTSLARFVAEAQATAQLQHPSIVPIHDIGAMEDGRVWFTMKEVRGQTLGDVVAELHAGSRDRWERSAGGWTFRRVVAAFLDVCNAMAYAHERGVLHRDLKPANVMVGSYGETYVLDWGLAKVVGRDTRPLEDLDTSETELRDLLADEEPIVSGRTPADHTRMGTVSGTPAYMAPEQARGEIHKIDTRTDVYALGALLYEILSGRAPYDGRTALQVIEAVRNGPPRPVTDGVDAPVPAELVQLCERAMARDPEDRFGSAVAIADEVKAWLDGARRRAYALNVAEQALGGLGQASAMLERAAALQAEGDAMLLEIEPWKPEQDKAAAWSRQDEAASLRRAAQLREFEVDQGLHGALRVAPELPEAHAALANRYREQHALAESSRDEEVKAQSETQVRFHAGALPESHPVRRACLRYLRGEGALTLVTDPPGAEVELFRYELENRRLVETPFRELGKTPLHDVPLPMGSYLCVVRHPDRHTVRYPAEVGRLRHWDGRVPGTREPQPVWLPPTGYLGADEVYVPAGMFRTWGRTDAWCDGLVMHRFPITNRQYIAFLDDLVAQGDSDQALRHAPRERAGGTHGQGALIYAFDGTGFSLQADSDGDQWLPDWPVVHVDWHGARAYLAWLAQRTGRPWRLPSVLEWEKAAGGVDGRLYPWGDFLDPSWCCMKDSHRGEMLPCRVDTYPVNSSPCGVRGASGNVYDWTLDLHASASPQAQIVEAPTAPLESDSAPRVVKGGLWYGSAKTALLNTRSPLSPAHRDSFLGFRGVFRPDPTLQSA